jgi:hypothetical protein
VTVRCYPWTCSLMCQHTKRQLVGSSTAGNIFAAARHTSAAAATHCTPALASHSLHITFQAVPCMMQKTIHIMSGGTPSSDACHPTAACRKMPYIELFSAASHHCPVILWKKVVCMLWQPFKLTPNVTHASTYACRYIHTPAISGPHRRKR